MSSIELDGILDGLSKEDREKVPSGKNCIAIENDVAYGDLRAGSIVLLSDTLIVFKRERMTVARK